MTQAHSTAPESEVSRRSHGRGAASRARPTGFGALALLVLLPLASACNDRGKPGWTRQDHRSSSSNDDPNAKPRPIYKHEPDKQSKKTHSILEGG